MPTKQKALFLLEGKGNFAVQVTTIPEPCPGQALIKVRATTLNPINWKVQMFDFFIKKYPAILGSDAAGIVKKLSPSVTIISVGDKVYVSFNVANMPATHKVCLASSQTLLLTIPDHASNSTPSNLWSLLPRFVLS